MDLTVWTINRCTELLQGEDEHIRGILAPATVSFGVRDNSRQLMPDNEYFAPIPLKCIGNRYSATNLDPTGQALLNAICRKYSYFRNTAAFDTWWDETRHLDKPEVEDYFREVYMTTPRGVGYYDLLDPRGNNILIGYSQGGLVARYLAFLDRHVFKKNLIAAVFTISSPNWGSPLGNPNNKNHVASGLVEFFASILSFHNKSFSDLYSYLDGVTFDPIYLAIVAANKGKARVQTRELLETSVKWLSGLDNDPNSAFAEIGIDNYADPFSVLSLINNKTYSPSGVYTGSVISANPNFDEILRSAFIGGTPNGIKTWLAELVKRLTLTVIRHRKLFGIPIKENEQAAGRLYGRRVMVDLPATTTQGQTLCNDYGSDQKVTKAIGGVESIPAYSHDFAIPSIYQLLPDDERLLGQFINLYASHNSGKSQDYRAGRKNVEALSLLLEKLSQALR